MTAEACEGMMGMMEMMGSGNMMGGNMMGMGGMMMWPMLIGTLLFVILAVGGIVLLVRLLRNQSGGRDAERILHARLAKGEIGSEEYQERLSLLQSHK